MWWLTCNNNTCTSGRRTSFKYSWWWVLAPETCRVTAEIKPAQCCIKLVFHLTYTTMHGNTKLKKKVQLPWPVDQWWLQTASNKKEQWESAFQNGQVKQHGLWWLTAWLHLLSLKQPTVGWGQWTLDSKLWVLVVLLITLTPDDIEIDGLWNADINSPFIWHIAQNDFTADETNNRKHKTK